MDGFNAGNATRASAEQGGHAALLATTESGSETRRELCVSLKFSTAPHKPQHAMEDLPKCSLSLWDIMKVLSKVTMNLERGLLL